VACLTDTGPLVVSASEAPIALIGASIWVKLWLAAAMILGRLELLAIIVLLVPGSWRD
jgi:trk system potassium uptake protein TrkH